MATSNAVTVLEQIPVPPPPEATPKLTLPLTFLDLLCLHMIPVHRLIFYQHPISKTHFIDTLIPTLKNSLSLTLQHYPPLAGRLIASPDNSTPPEIRYEEGHTVPLILAEANSGECHFDDLTSGLPRICTEFHPLVPSLPPASRAPDGSVVVPVLALQVTLFSGVGICIGITNHHAVGDASSIFGFMKAWALVSSHESPVSLPAEIQPFYDRTVIRDEKGLETFFWDNVKRIKVEDRHVHRLPQITDRIRATFTLTRDDIQRLKNRILAGRPNLAHISSFTTTCSYIWICWVKSRYESDTDKIDDDEDEFFNCAADCRSRLDPPVPGNYFGNCLVACFGYAKTKRLRGEEGLLDAAEGIGEAIRRQLYDKERGVLGGAEDWFKLMSKLKIDRVLTVIGSPRFDYYELDFGWGNPKMFQMPSTDLSRGISLSKAKDQEGGGLEIGVTVLEQIPVAPPPEGTPKITLRLTFLDVLWLHMGPVHRLIFYQHPISRTHFLETLIPAMKHSLSLTLRHYTPLVGRVIVSADNSILPEIRYEEGDTVLLVLAESEGDFGHLTSDHAKSCTDFHPLVPALPPASRAPDGSAVVPVLALQVTLFPDVGICVGVTNHHATGDASCIFRFMKAWEFFSNLADKTTSSVSLPPEFVPAYDRTMIRDPKGLESLFWDNIKNIKIEDTHVHRLPLITNRARLTFILTKDDIQRLKNHILAHRPEQKHVSSFTVICSYVWTCLVKSRYGPETENTDNEDEIFGCAAECRARLDPPAPENYFGNCLTAVVGFAKTEQLTSEKALVDAAALIGDSIRGQLYDKESGVFKGAEDWFALLSAVKPDRSLSVAGSPKFDYYELDFGWGRPKKFEFASIDLTGAISFGKARDIEGGLEIGLSLLVTQIDSFSRIFTHGLKAL
nr:malonyl-coenzyme A:anthocyanin 3-O-glucoside-6''-O-malonyltransferase-like [Ipomoea batatas]